MDTFLQDLRYGVKAFKTMAHLIAVVTLALG